MNPFGLNAQQQEAVETADGALCIIAGPGTGKTKTLTARIATLLQKGVPAHHILALTFTNKAAREMRERAAALLEPNTALPVVATFHALAHQLLSKPDKPLAIVNEDERLRIIKQIKKTQKLKPSARELSLRISLLKSQPGIIADPDVSGDDLELQLVEPYNQALAAAGLCDYDDLLLRLHEHLRSATNLPYQYILVDEFQDTNQLQYELLRLLDKTGNVCVIGDPLQSIYGFRGANAAIFERFLYDYPAARQVTLTTNYRSVPQVVQLANAVFADAPQLVAHTTARGQAQVVETLNEYGEAAWILAQIEQGIGGSDLLKSAGQSPEAQTAQRTFRDFAVLYRTHAAARALRTRLDEAGIPYQVAGEGSPYQRPEIVKVLAALRYVAGDQSALAQTGCTAAQAKVLLGPLSSQDQPHDQLAHRIAELLDVTAKLPQHDLQQFAQLLQRLHGQPLMAALEYIQQLAEQEYYDPAAEAATLLTIHAAKGLEFTHVFLLGTEEGLLPHQRLGAKTPSAQQLAEEQRLFYVAVTRARERLDLLHTRTRAGKPAKLSQFAANIPSNILPRLTDPDLAEQAKRRERARQKRAQTSLF